MKLLSRDRDKIIAVIAATLLICVFIVAVVRDGSGDAVSLRPGSRGNVVYEVQRRLRDWGYYGYAADGVFGTQTMYAVQTFQIRHGLTPDGVVGPATAAKLGVNLYSAATAGSAAATGSLKPGSRGAKVSEVQQKLRDWGYYKGAVDGIYGKQTMYAVQDFQTKHGLSPDGIVGPATAAKLGVSLTGTGGAATSGGGASASTGSTNVHLLARLVYAEARGEPYTGQVAVASVVLNRMDSALFPNSIAGVIYQPGAFSVVADGQINLAPDATAVRAARDALNGWDPSNGSLYYYNPARTTNSFMLSKPVLLVIGEHRFCR